MITKCPTQGCGAPIEHADSVAFEEGVFKCDECLVRHVFGKPGPRTIVSPSLDERGRTFITLIAQDPFTKAELHAMDLDPKFAALLAADLLSLCPGDVAKRCVRLLMGDAK